MTNLLHNNDVAGHYPQSWYQASTELLLPFTPLDVDQQCDVCIVGAGYTGMSAALHLVESGFDVVLLDAHRVGWGASGRNGGQLGSGQRLDQKKLESMLGFDEALKLWRLAEQSKKCVHDLIARHEIDCEYHPGVVYADHRPGFVEDTRQYVDHLNSHYDYEEIEFIDQQKTSDVLGTDVYYGASFDRGAGHLHPLKLAIGLARAAQVAGVRIFENSEVVATSHEADSSGKVSATTPYASVKADHLLYACNGYLGSLAPEVGRRVMPINNYIIATEPLDNVLADNILVGDVAAADSRFVVNYFRCTADQRLLFGGRESYGYRFPKDIDSKVRSTMLNIYPQLVETEIEYAWGGTLAITRSRLPHLVRLQANVLSASGYSGHGVAMAILSGKLIAEAIQGESAGFNVFANIPANKFPGGALMRSPLLTLAMLWYALRDRL